MKPEHDLSIQLRLWSEGDLPLLTKLLGDPAMTEHLGGPENAEQLARRNKRFVEMGDSSAGRMFTIRLGDELEGVGSIGYWEKEHHGQTVYEMGWSVLPAFQGQGIATKAIGETIMVMRADAKHRFVYAYPSVMNGASNAICRKAGFTLIGEEEFEYPKGHLMRCNDWRFGLGEDNEDGL